MINKVRVVFEDEYLVVVNKPHGLVCNRAETVVGETLQDWMDSRYKVVDPGFMNDNERLEEIFRERSGMVHRLDKDTSGVMVWAKNPGVMLDLMRQFKQRETEKEYLALVYGRLEPRDGFVKLPVARSSDDRQKFAVNPFGKSALTFYGVEDYYRLDSQDAQEKWGRDQGFSLVRVILKTGRTHQIRVHLTHLGHPLVGDEKYAGKKRYTRDKDWCGRQFLHAAKLGFRHPNSQERVSYEADLAKDLVEVLDGLKIVGENGN